MAVTVAGDIVNPATMGALVSEAAARFGRVNALFNNVGILIIKSLLDTTATDFDRLMHVNCLSHLITIQRVAPEMKKAGGGSIINVSSIGGIAAFANMSVYCASKAAVLGLSRAVAYELAPDIRVNAIAREPSTPRWRASCSRRSTTRRRRPGSSPGAS